MKIQRLFSSHFLLVAAFMLSACGGAKHTTNHAPTAMDAMLKTQADTELKGTLTATDSDGDKLTFTTFNSPQKGTLMLSADGSYSYTPNADTTGTDQFTFRVWDGKVTSSLITVSITIDQLGVALGHYSRTAFSQDATADPLPLNSRDVELDVTDEAAFDDLLL